jgi:regulatory protein
VVFIVRRPLNAGSPSDQASRIQQPMTSQKKSKSDKGLYFSGNHHQKALNSALRILTGRDHSEYELTRKLKQRGFIAEDIEKAISECIRLDYINDERTAGVYIRQLIRKGYGVRRIRHDMDKKGLKGKQVQNLLSKTFSDADEHDSAVRVLKKNIRRFERESDPRKRRDKIFRFLYGRGFSQEIIRKILKK